MPQTLEHLEGAIISYELGLAIKARDGKISMDDMLGGTFTITNGGVFGQLSSSILFAQNHQLAIQKYLR